MSLNVNERLFLLLSLDKMDDYIPIFSAQTYKNSAVKLKETKHKEFH